MAEAAGAVLAAVRALATSRSTWTVLIDGRSGAGKSTLADRIVQLTGAALVRLDDLYPGWDGLAAGADAVRQGVLVPRRTGRPGGGRRWDWSAGRPAGRVAVPATGGLVCEGSGVLTRRSAPLADLTLWIELDDAARKRRALQRDGDAYAPHWQRWAAQEEEAIRAERPQALAARVVDGTTVQALPRERSAAPPYCGCP